MSLACCAFTLKARVFVFRFRFSDEQYELPSFHIFRRHSFELRVRCISDFLNKALHLFEDFGEVQVRVRR